MKLIIPPLEINPDNPFKEDIFKRKPFAESLTNLVKKSDDEFVISLDGQWGEGKTTFVKMWQVMLKENDIPNVYIDAFANDHIDDPFITVVSAIIAYVDKKIPKDKSKNFMEKSKKIGVQLMSWTAKAAIKTATLGVIKDSEIEELVAIKDDIIKGVDGVLEGIIEEKLKSHIVDINSLKVFKELLSRLPSQLGKSDKPLVIVLDELDRCRPTYALEMLEKIKHLFSIKNVVFFLVMNKEQMGESVKCIYGQSIDANTYLQKFINVETKLPYFKDFEYRQDISIYCKKLFELHEVKDWGQQFIIEESLEILGNHFNLSLRQLERVFTSLLMFHLSEDQNESAVIHLVIFIAIVKVIKPKLYNRMVLKKVEYNELAKELKLSNLDKENSEKLEHSLCFLKYTTLSDKEYNDLSTDSPIKKCNFFNKCISHNRKDWIAILNENLNIFRLW